jgi:hypothetical protein
MHVADKPLCQILLLVTSKAGNLLIIILLRATQPTNSLFLGTTAVSDSIANSNSKPQSEISPTGSVNTMSLKEAYTLAHSARCKLYLSANRQDRNLRFLVGHAMHLDALMLRIVEIEESIEEAPHAAEVDFGDVSGVCLSHRESPLAVRRSPPPRAAEEESDSDPSDDGADNENENEVGNEEELGLTRFPSGSARPTRDSPAPQFDPSDGGSSSSDDDYNFDLSFLRDIVTKSGGDEGLKSLYDNVQNCPCNKSDAPTVERVWEIPSDEWGKKGVRVAVAEVRV